LANNRLTEVHPDTLLLLRRLGHLDLSNVSISKIHPVTFLEITGLEWPSLSNNRLTEIHPDTFNPLDHLRHLDLSSNMISSIQPETLHNDSVLEWLSLANNILNEIHLRIFQNHSKISCLLGYRTTKIEGAVFYCNRKRDTLLLTSNKISNLLHRLFAKRVN
jgi:Leucine Rich Repeat.